MTETGPKVALITGITGQDGSYLAELLLSKGYQVNGMMRRSSSFNTERVKHIYQDPHEKNYKFKLWYGDLADASVLIKLLATIKPDEVYNLGAQSHVRVSFDIPEYTADVDAMGTLRLLEAIRFLNLPCKFYQASSSEMFGSALPPQNEETPFKPRSPYAVSKVFSHYITVNYREAYGLFACSGILMNHESPRRGETFVTKKITHGLAKILAGKQEKIYLGNLDAKRDWGYCYDDKTEILTKDGWKLFKDLVFKDTVVTLDRKGLLRYTKPTEFIVKEYYGEMIQFQNRHLDLLVTPNHKMYVRAGDMRSYELVSANEVFKSINKWKFKKDARWNGEELKQFFLPSISKYKNKRIEAEKKLHMDSWLEFLGWFISEGHCGKGIKGSYRVGISQDKKNNKYRMGIIKCLEKLNFKFGVDDHEFRINDKQLWNYLKQFGKARNKHVPSFIKDLCTEQIMIFLDALFKGDGNGKIDINKNCNFYTSSVKLINDVQELLLKCGLSGNIKLHKNRESAYRINVISKYNHPCFRANKNAIVRYTNYNGKIYCCTVPDHVIYVRRNGKACWCGNSAEYVEAMHLMLQQAKPDDYVIATGETHSVREFLQEAFGLVGLDFNKYIEIDKKYFRPSEVEQLCGDSSKAKKNLGWEARVRFKDLTRLMVIEDLKKEGIDPTKYGLEQKPKLTSSYLKDVS